MNETNKNEVIILVIVEGGLSISEAVSRFGISRRWIFKLLARYRAEGLTGLQTKSRRPQSNPSQTSQSIKEEVLRLRHQLHTQGLDAGPESIWNHLDPDTRPSTSTIWRILKQAG